MIIAGISLLILIILLISGAPVAFAFIASAVFMMAIGGYDPLTLIPYTFGRLSSMVLLCLPFFILAGGMMEKGGIAKHLINFVDTVVSRVRGGMGAVGTVTCGIFGAISGTSASAICCIGPIMIPQLEKEGYPRGYATSLITSAAALALLIPPSADMILYGWVSGTPITACFLAGVGPGILLMLLFILFNWIMVGRLSGVKEPRPWGRPKQMAKEVAHRGWRASAALIMPIIILGSIYGGVATPTEAAAVAVAYAIPVGFFIYRGLTVRVFVDTLIRNATTIGVIMILLFGAVMLCRMFVLEQVPRTITVFLLGISDNKYVILLMVNLVLIALGMIMDDASAILISVPLLLPLITTIGINHVHFSAIITTNLAMGCMTPPVAPLLYTGQRVGEVPFADMIGTSMKLIIFAFLPVVLITTYWPPLSMWLPELVLGSKILGF